MIEVRENVREGDIVYAWFSPFKEKNPLESEYRVTKLEPGSIALESMSDNTYGLVIGKELLEKWLGNVRKAN